MPGSVTFVTQAFFMRDYFFSAFVGATVYLPVTAVVLGKV